MMGFRDGSGISWTICKQSAPRSRQITTPTPHHSETLLTDEMKHYVALIITQTHARAQFVVDLCSNYNKSTTNRTSGV